MLEPHTSETIFRVETFDAIGQIGRLAALNAHAHEVITSAETGARVQQFANPTARDIHRIDALLTRSHHPTIAAIVRVKAVETLVTITGIHETIADTPLAIDVIHSFPYRSHVDHTEFLQIFYHCSFSPIHYFFHFLLVCLFRRLFVPNAVFFVTKIGAEEAVAATMEINAKITVAGFIATQKVRAVVAADALDTFIEEARSLATKTVAEVFVVPRHHF